MVFQLFARTQEYQSLSEIHPMPLQRLYEHWRNACFVGNVPRQRDVTPTRVPECISNIAFVGIEQNPARARYVIIGYKLRQLLGRDPSGMTVEEAYSKSVSREIYEAFGKTVRSRNTTFYKREFIILGQRFGYYRLILPLRLEDERVSRLLIGIYPTDENLADSKPWQRALSKLKHGNRATSPESVQGVDEAWDDSMLEDGTVKTTQP